MSELECLRFLSCKSRSEADLLLHDRNLRHSNSDIRLPYIFQPKILDNSRIPIIFGAFESSVFACSVQVQQISQKSAPHSSVLGASEKQLQISDPRPTPGSDILDENLEISKMKNIIMIIISNFENLLSQHGLYQFWAKSEVYQLISSPFL